MRRRARMKECQSTCPRMLSGKRRVREESRPSGPRSSFRATAPACVSWIRSPPRLSTASCRPRRTRLDCTKCTAMRVNGLGTGGREFPLPELILKARKQGKNVSGAGDQSNLLPLPATVLHASARHQNCEPAILVFGPAYGSDDWPVASKCPRPVPPKFGCFPGSELWCSDLPSLPRPASPRAIPSRSTPSSDRRPLASGRAHSQPPPAGRGLMSPETRASRRRARGPRRARPSSCSRCPAPWPPRCAG